MKHYLEFQDSKSHKFWQIELEGQNFTVTYGKIGSTGQSKTQQFGSAEQAEREASKLLQEKLRKGYQEKQVASAKKISKRISVSYEEGDNGKTLLGKVQTFLESEQAATTEALTFGSWEEAFDCSPQEALDALVELSARLPALRELFVGDMDSEECEISWIQQGDYTRVLAAFPQLKRLHIKGSQALEWSTQAVCHTGLEALVIECGGLPARVLEQILQAELPNLQHLELYLGVEDYGGDAPVELIARFLEPGRFPALRYLGLKNSELADEIAALAANSPLLAQLEVLDMSMGTLTDQGGQALLDSQAVLKLAKLDLSYHYLSNSMMKSLKALPLQVDVSDQQEEEDDWRYPAVTE